MLVFFSGRRLKGGHWDEFRRAWGGGDGDQDLSGLPEGSVVYHARNIKDEDEVIRDLRRQSRRARRDSRLG